MRKPSNETDHTGRQRVQTGAGDGETANSHFHRSDPIPPSPVGPIPILDCCGRMIDSVLADAVLLLHFAFVVFVAAGGLLVLRWPRLAWLHPPAAVWGHSWSLRVGSVRSRRSRITCGKAPVAPAIRETSSSTT